MRVTVGIKWSMSQSSTVTANQALNCFRRRVASRLRKAVIPLCSALVRLPLHGASSLVPPTLRGMWRNWRHSCRSYHEGRDDEHVPYKERWRELVQSLVKKTDRGDMVRAYVYVKRRCKDV